LTNGNRLPFVVVMDCLNGFFDDPSVLSVSEALLQAPNGGAVASFASSGLTIPDGQHEMGLKMFQLLYGGASIPIGDASRQAKTATNDRDVRRTWILLGDPTLKIR
ncbi:MAG TPA: C25 family cysteine peptidase, partial [Pyrinomonadaceae bacterium]|nr:C25 family cysteine peptidase [Pyrinomonadaceae bacterium]